MRLEPAIGERLERCGSQCVESVAALSPALDESGVLWHAEVLRDRLPWQNQLMLARYPGAELEQGLCLPFGEFVEQLASRGIGEGLEHVTHRHSIGKRLLACQPSRAALSVAHVAMGEAPRMCGVELVGELRDQRNRAPRLQRTPAMQQRTEVRAFDVAHRDIQLALALTGLVDGHDPRVLDRGGHPRLHEEPRTKA